MTFVIGSRVDRLAAVEAPQYLTPSWKRGRPPTEVNSETKRLKSQAFGGNENKLPGGQSKQSYRGANKAANVEGKLKKMHFF